MESYDALFTFVTRIGKQAIIHCSFSDKDGAENGSLSSEAPSSGNNVEVLSGTSRSLQLETLSSTSLQNPSAIAGSDTRSTVPVEPVGQFGVEGPGNEAFSGVSAPINDDEVLSNVNDEVGELTLQNSPAELDLKAQTLSTLSTAATASRNVVNVSSDANDDNWLESSLEGSLASGSVEGSAAHTIVVSVPRSELEVVSSMDSLSEEETASTKVKNQDFYLQFDLHHSNSFSLIKPTIMASVHNDCFSPLYMRNRFDFYKPGKRRLAHVETTWDACYPKGTEFMGRDSDIFSTLHNLPSWFNLRENDDVTVVWYLEVIKGPEWSAHDVDITHNKQFLEVNSLNESLFLSYYFGLFCDFSLSCGGQQFPCHRQMLSSRSPVFEAMLSSRWLESHTGCLVLDDLVPREVIKLLYLIYGQSLSSQSSSKEILRLLIVCNRFLVEIPHEVLIELIEAMFDGDFEASIDMSHLALCYGLKYLDVRAALTALTHDCTGQRNIPVSPGGAWLDVLLASSKSPQKLGSEIHLEE